jgi:type I restriction enzyme S subunit
MQKLFTEGIYGEKQKQTEIGLLPESWEEIAIGDLGKCVTGTTPKTAVEQYWNSNDFDFIAPADIGKSRYVYDSEKKMSKEGLLVSRILPPNSIMCVCIGSSIGKLGLSYKNNSATNQQINSVICNERYNSIYTFYLLTFFSEHWRSHATFGPVPILNKGQFELIKLYGTKDKKEQKIIAESLQVFDNKVDFLEKKKQTLTSLFKTLLHELMTGQRRVHKLDFEKTIKEYAIVEQPLSMVAEREESYG